MNDQGKVDESKITIEPAKVMRIWNDVNPLPAGALHGTAAVEAALKKPQTR